MSENYRTEVVHNGKSLFELYKGRTNDIERELNKIRCLIIEAVINIYEAECYTYDSLDSYREQLKSDLGIG